MMFHILNWIKSSEKVKNGLTFDNELLFGAFILGFAYLPDNISMLIYPKECNVCNISEMI
jgi:hypothetical protein